MGFQKSVFFKLKLQEKGGGMDAFDTLLLAQVPLGRHSSIWPQWRPSTTVPRELSVEDKASRL